MKILFDFSQIPEKRTGVGVYADHLLRELLLQLRDEDHLIVLIQHDEHKVPSMLRGQSNATFRRLPAIFRNRLILLFFEQTFLPLILAHQHIDIIHSLHYTHPLYTLSRRVVTIHDLTLITMPELHTLGRKLVFPFFIKHALRFAESLIFVSQATENDAASIVPVSQAIKAVIPLGVDPKMYNAIYSRQILNEHGVTSPFLLFLGTIEPRKNIGRLIEAFDKVAEEYELLSLVIVGKRGWKYQDVFQRIESSKFRKRILVLGYATEQEKASFLQHSTALVFPSLYEGFGLPVLEGMAAGTPVITSNLSSLPEVGGDAAILVDPFSSEAIADAVRKILDDPQMANAMRVKGKSRAEEFSWQRVAAETYALYRRTLKL